MENENSVVKHENTNAPAAVPAEMQTRLDRLAFDEKLDQFFMEKAGMMAKSPLMPPLFRGDTYGCYALQQLAFQWEMNPVLLAPGLYKVSADSPLSLEGKTVKSIIDRWAPVRDGFISDEYFGDWDKILGKFETRTSKTKMDKYGNPSTYKVPAWKPEDEEGLGITLRATTNSGHEISYTLKMTQCLTRNSTLWAEDPQLQLFYRAIARFARKYFPGILGGMYVKEEIMDGEVIDVTPTAAVSEVCEKKSKTEAMKEKLGIRKEKAEPEKAEDKPAEEKKPAAKATGAIVYSEVIAKYIEKSGAPCTVDDVKQFLRESRKLNMDIDDADKLPLAWKDYIVNNTSGLIEHTVGWMQSAEA